MNDKGTILMPPAASVLAKDVDDVFYFLTYLSAFFFCLILALMVLFVWRYRRRSDADTTPAITHNNLLEAVWTIIPTILIVIIFFWGFSAYLGMRKAPHESLAVQVTAKRWQWVFTYPNGTVSFNELVVPAGQPVKLTMNSEDVIHSFFVPDFRIKQDVIPNRYSTLWFEAPNPGEHNLFCTEYCGKSHSDMIGRIKVLPETEYKKWLETGGLDFEKTPPAEIGKMLFKSRSCNACHSVDGAKNIGPTFKGLFGHQVKLANGAEALADENYIRKSMMEPMSDIVAGYQPVMPTYKGLLKDREVNALIEYIKTLQ
jgi:cytochrome c oxidase subunit 2